MDIALVKDALERVKKSLRKIGRDVIRDRVDLDAVYCESTEPVPFEERGKLDYVPIHCGSAWGGRWKSAWFRLRGTTPEHWSGGQAALLLNVGGEALVFDAHGMPLQGLSNGSVFDPEFTRDYYLIPEPLVGRESVEYWVEGVGSSLKGIEYPPNKAELPSPERYGYYSPTVSSMSLGLFDRETWHLELDIMTLFGLVCGLDPRKAHRSRLVKVLSDCVAAYEAGTEDAAGCRAILRPMLGDSRACSSALRAIGVGHAHIDTAWMWPIRETVRKVGRTFASQVNLLERYPEYRFSASVPLHYEWAKRHYPSLYSKIRVHVEEGRWEPIGAMWIEADCNIPSGESLVRQILYGKNFFMSEFGVDVRNLWLPDVFGYSAALPQILRQSGVEFFLTQKLSWNQTNRFPHNSFRWVGIDGSSVICHFPPGDTCNSTLVPYVEYQDEPQGTVFSEYNYSEKAFLDEFLVLYGIGDGGGGPTPEMIEQGLRQANLEGAPVFSFGTASAFFDRLREHSSELSVWRGELYLEMHRGTFTTCGALKRGNRRLESLLRDAEMISTCLRDRAYPKVDLESLWKTLLLNQFHDIIPGSSIRMVNEEAENQFRAAIEKAETLIDDGAGDLGLDDTSCLTVFNSYIEKHTATLALPVEWGNCRVQDGSGRVLDSQHSGSQTMVRVTVEGLDTLVLERTPGGSVDASVSSPANTLVLENELVRYVFSESGQVTEALDKETGTTILRGNGNCLRLYRDEPLRFEAWNIDSDYRSLLMEELEAESFEMLYSGPVASAIEFRYTWGESGSSLRQVARLSSHKKTLEFENWAQWYDRSRMLRVSFPANIRADKATCEIQYGNTERPTHANTTWESAKYEVCCHRYVDVSDASYGVALLNDCKYGHSLADSVLDLNLLRGPISPDPDADLGAHEFRFALYPHDGSFIQSQTVSEARLFNSGFRVFPGRRIERFVPFRIDGSVGISLEAFKRGETDENAYLRLVETLGVKGRCRITTDDDRVLIASDLMEWNELGSVQEPGVDAMEFRPFEIKTIKIVEPSAK